MHTDTKIIRWGMQPLVSLIFHNLPSLYHLLVMIFYLYNVVYTVSESVGPS